MAVIRHTNSRFAVYLIPPYKVARDVTEIHRLLRKQFGFFAADRFQVHATFKGFFKKTAGPLEPLVERLDAVFAAQHPFAAHLCGFRIDSVGIGLDISRLGNEPNPDMTSLRERVVEALGAQNLLTVQIGADIVKVATHPTFEVDPGTDVWLRFPADKIRWVDRDSSRVLYPA